MGIESSESQSDGCARSLTTWTPTEPAPLPRPVANAYVGRRVTKILYDTGVRTAIVPWISFRRVRVPVGTLVSTVATEIDLVGSRVTDENRRRLSMSMRMLNMSVRMLTISMMSAAICSRISTDQYERHDYDGKPE